MDAQLHDCILAVRCCAGEIVAYRLLRNTFVHSCTGLLEGHAPRSWREWVQAVAYAASRQQRQPADRNSLRGLRRHWWYASSAQHTVLHVLSVMPILMQPCWCVDYNDDTHHLAASVCSYPAYMSGAGEGSKPYFIPLRALMVDDAPNLLVAGKLMSESFHANSNTRLHPSEWTSGVAAGGTAALMVRRQWKGTALALTNVQVVRQFLNSSAVGQPLVWNSTSIVFLRISAGTVILCVTVAGALTLL